MNELRPAGKFVEVPSWTIPANALVVIVLSIIGIYQAIINHDLTDKLVDVKHELIRTQQDLDTAYKNEDSLGERLLKCQRFHK